MIGCWDYAIRLRVLRFVRLAAMKLTYQVKTIETKYY